MNCYLPISQGQLVQLAPTPRRGKWRISSVNRPTASPIPPRRWRSWWMRRMHRRVRPVLGVNSRFCCPGLVQTVGFQHFVWVGFRGSPFFSGEGLSSRSFTNFLKGRLTSRNFLGYLEDGLQVSVVNNHGPSAFPKTNPTVKADFFALELSRIVKVTPKFSNTFQKSCKSQGHWFNMIQLGRTYTDRWKTVKVWALAPENRLFAPRKKKIGGWLKMTDLEKWKKWRSQKSVSLVLGSCYGHSQSE